jgi:agmatine/peptidylarginine deiminase
LKNSIFFRALFLGVLSFAILMASRAWADESSHAPSPFQIREMKQWNRKHRLENRFKVSGLEPEHKIERPYAEYEPAQYLLFSSALRFDSSEVKKTLAKELPVGVNLVIVSPASEPDADLKTYYSEFLKPERIHILKTRIEDAFWTRDALPIPVFEMLANYQPSLALVHSRYYHGFDSQAEVSKRFHAPVSENEFYFEGGNFLADSKGNCLIVNNNMHAEIPDTTFITLFGCDSLTRLPFVDGIGHIDERVKLLSDTEALTDTESYKGILERLGFHVTMLPKPKQPDETYLNALLVNGTLFLPIFDQSTDAEVIRQYESFHLKVVPIRVDSLPNVGRGSIHCITMTYPPAPYEEVRRSLANFAN